MDPLNVRPSQFAVLVLIWANPGFSQSAISRTLGIQRANFVSMLDELQRRGMIERRAALNDRRSFALHLTKLGQAYVKQIQAAHARLENALGQRLGARKSRTLLRLLNNFADAAGARSDTVGIRSGRAVSAGRSKI
jgi:DNA-binding MarR family transcriptional regulator